VSTNLLCPPTAPLTYSFYQPIVGLLDLLKAHKQGIRRAAVNSFGYIAKSLGPQDVHSVLLTNLLVQERQSRVCSTVAIAIVVETCGPFTCIPAILN
jgi:splicing factor 3B subunit 1